MSKKLSRLIEESDFDGMSILLSGRSRDDKEFFAVKKILSDHKIVMALLSKNENRAAPRAGKNELIYQLVRAAESDILSFQVAVILFKNRQFDTTLKLLSLIEKKKSEHLNLLGLVELNVGSKVRACDLFEQALRHRAHADEGIWQNLILGLRRRGLYQEAVSECKRALLRFPDSKNLRLSLFRAYSALGDLKKIREQKNILETNYISDRHVLWSLYGQSEDMEQARKYLQLIVKLAPDFQRARAHLSLLNIKKEYPSNFDYFSVGDKETLIWLRELKKEPVFLPNRWSLFDYCVGQLNAEGRAYYEFGVFTGASISYNCKHFGLLYGFDTFDGLPMDWWREAKGSYSAEGKIPSVPGAVFIRGVFSESAAKFLKQPQLPMAGIANFDADLYESTLDALFAVEKKLDEKSILIFDEFIMNDSWRHDEYKALEEFCTNKQLSYEVIAICLFSKQVAVRLLM